MSILRKLLRLLFRTHGALLESARLERQREIQKAIAFPSAQRHRKAGWWEPPTEYLAKSGCLVENSNFSQSSRNTKAVGHTSTSSVDPTGSTTRGYPHRCWSFLDHQSSMLSASPANLDCRDTWLSTAARPRTNFEPANDTGRAGFTSLPATSNARGTTDGQERGSDQVPTSKPGLRT